MICSTCKDKSGNGIPLHYNQKKNYLKGIMGFYDYHNDLRFGLGRNDTTKLLFGLTKNEWCEPDRELLRKNAEHIKSFHDK